MRLGFRQRRSRPRRRDRRAIDHRIELAGGVMAPCNARRAVAEAMRDRRDLPPVHDVQLVVSELVTNSVVHGRAGEAEKIELSVTLFPYVVRVAVADPLGGFTSPVAPVDHDGPGGRGLRIVRALASRWGLRPGQPGQLCYEVGRPL